MWKTRIELLIDSVTREICATHTPTPDRISLYIQKRTTGRDHDIP
jgi:hypothetical protein